MIKYSLLSLALVSNLSLADFKIDSKYLMTGVAPAVTSVEEKEVLSHRSFGGVFTSGYARGREVYLDVRAENMPFEEAITGSHLLPRVWEVRSVEPGALKNLSRITWKEGDSLRNVLESYSEHEDVRFHVDYHHKRLFVEAIKISEQDRFSQVDLEGELSSLKFFIPFAPGRSGFEDVLGLKELFDARAAINDRSGEIRAVSVRGVSLGRIKGSSKLALQRAESINSYLSENTSAKKLLGLSINVGKSKTSEIVRGVEIVVDLFAPVKEKDRLEILDVGDPIDVDVIKLTKPFDVAFSVGEYRELSGEAEDYVSQFLDGTDVTGRTVVITGYSMSYNARASDELALLRALAIKKAMVGAGAKPHQIILKMYSEGGVSGKPLKHVASIQVSNTISMADPKPLPDSLQALAEGRELCGLIDIQEGRLRVNYERNLQSCGFSIGRWEFESKGGVTDWIISKKNTVKVGSDVESVMAFFRSEYGLASSVDGALVTVRDINK